MPLRVVDEFLPEGQPADLRGLFEEEQRRRLCHMSATDRGQHAVRQVRERRLPSELLLLLLVQRLIGSRGFLQCQWQGEKDVEGAELKMKREISSQFVSFLLFQCSLHAKIVSESDRVLVCIIYMMFIVIISIKPEQNKIVEENVERSNRVRRFSCSCLR
jgi:hypothetical protein